MAGKPDPKPRRRVRLSRYSYDRLVSKMRKRYPLCECGCGRRSESFHHVVPRSWGDDADANGMMLAGDGTRLCHGALTCKQRVYDAMRDEYIDPLEVQHRLRERMELVRIDVREYVLDRRSAAWLDRMYPARPDSRQSAR